jgi:hypothetical protein
MVVMLIQQDTGNVGEEDAVEWSFRHVAGMSLDVPKTLAPRDERGIEGDVAVLEGAGVRLTIDTSPFADPLTRYTDKPGYEHWQEDIGGVGAEFLTFEEGGMRTLATRDPSMFVKRGWGLCRWC